MKLGVFLAALTAPLAFPAAAPAQTRPASVDWTRTVVATPEGGFRMGNPNAALKLVEYASLTCPHCATFAREGMATLRANHIRSGRVSFELRNYVLNGIDVTASLLARCAAPADFFRITERLFETQPLWINRITELDQAEKDRLRALPEGQRLVRIAELGGLNQIAAQNGVNLQRARQCLSDPTRLEQLGRMTETASGMGVEGTPTFFLNGRMLDVNVWQAIEPLLGG